MGNISEPAKWLRDADSHYIGARALGRQVAAALTVYMDPFFTLAHGTLERYLKGILSGIDGSKYSSGSLKKTFVHDLSALLREVRLHRNINSQDLDWAVDILDAEWSHARYTVSADMTGLKSDAVEFGLSHLDRLVAALRNELIPSVSPVELEESILLTLWRSAIPFQGLRESFVSGNESLKAFKGFEN